MANHYHLSLAGSLADFAGRERVRRARSACGETIEFRDFHLFSSLARFGPDMADFGARPGELDPGRLSVVSAGLEDETLANRDRINTGRRLCNSIFSIYSLNCRLNKSNSFYSQTSRREEKRARERETRGKAGLCGKLAAD